MKYDPKKKLFYYDGRLEEYRQADCPTLHTILYQYDDDSEEFKIVDMKDEDFKKLIDMEKEKVGVLYEKALTAFKKEEKKVDNVNHPKHYEGNCSIECIDAMRFALGDEGLAFFCAGNAFKYLWRYKFKNGEEDLDKAGWYRDRLLNLRLVNPVENDTIKDLTDKVSKLYLTVTGKEENAAFEGEDEEDD